MPTPQHRAMGIQGIPEVKATLRYQHVDGSWSAYTSRVDFPPRGSYFVVPAEAFSLGGGVTPRKGLRVILQIADPSERGVTAVSWRIDPDYFSLPSGETELQDRLARSADHPTRILVVGRTGVGKSSTINSLIGAVVASVGDFEPTTNELALYKGTVGGASVVILDTPGFADTRSDRSRDHDYVQIIKKNVAEVDLLLFVTGINEPRVERGELDTLRILAEEFPSGLWDRAIVVLTRADQTSSRTEYSRVLEGRTRVLRDALQEAIGSQASLVPFVPISNRSMRTPDRKLWLTQLWIQALHRLSDQGFESFLLATISRVRRIGPSHGKQKRRSLSDREPGEWGQTLVAQLSTNSPIPDPASLKTDALTIEVPDAAHAPDLREPPSLPDQEMGHSDQSSVSLPVATEIVAMALPESDRQQPGWMDPELISSSSLPDFVAVAPAVLRTSRIVDNGFTVQETQFRTEQGMANIFATNSEVNVIQNTIERRDPALIEIFRAIGGAVAVALKAVRHLFTGA